MIERIALLTCWALLTLFSIINLIGALGFHKYRNFYLRLHTATVISLGGAFYPLLTLAVIAFIDRKVYLGVSFLLASLLVLTLSPTGTHALARATYRRGVASPRPIVEDHLKEDRGEGGWT